MRVFFANVRDSTGNSAQLSPLWSPPGDHTGLPFPYHQLKGRFCLPPGLNVSLPFKPLVSMMANKALLPQHSLSHPNFLPSDPK